MSPTRASNVAIKSASSLAPRLLPIGNPTASSTSPTAGTSTTTDTLKRISSRALLGQASSLIIDHEGVRYVLRATRLGKLILTK